MIRGSTLCSTAEAFKAECSFPKEAYIECQNIKLLERESEAVNIYVALR